MQLVARGVFDEDKIFEMCTNDGIEVGVEESFEKQTREIIM